MGAWSHSRMQICHAIRLALVRIVVPVLLSAAHVRAQSPFLDRKPVQSSDLCSVGYDEQKRILEIEFHSGGIYQYLDVPKALFARLLAAESKGRFFASHIRDRFRFQQVTPRTSVAR